MYWVFTSEKNKKVLSTKDISESFDFISKNLDAKVWTMDHTAKTKIFNRQTFIEKYFKLTKNEENTFKLAEIMIKGNNNFQYFLQQIGLKEKYTAYKSITEKQL